MQWMRIKIFAEFILVTLFIIILFHRFLSPFHPLSLYSFLENLQEVAENNNFFDPGFSPDQMSHIPDLYRSIIDDPATLHDIIIQAKGQFPIFPFSNVYNLGFVSCINSSTGNFDIKYANDAAFLFFCLHTIKYSLFTLTGKECGSI